jgi:hypothetical protein
MSKKLQKNGLFESSRMMLPEHKESYLLHQQQLDKRTRPILDEQQTENISRLIAESMLTGKEVTFLLFGGFEEREVTGKVMRIDQQKKAIKLANSMGDEWIRMGFIINVL